MKRIIRVFQILRRYGVRFCAFRLMYTLRKKFGLLKRKFSCQLWSEIKLSDWLKSDFTSDDSDFLQIHRDNGRRFFFDSNNLPKLNEECKEKVIAEADDILQNKFRYFSNRTYSLGSGPDWFLNPVTGKRANPDIHWCDVKIFDPNLGDIKCIWEPSRFSWSYTLVRVFAATGNERYVEKFWNLFESWLKANQPNMGPNYVCGQECALRLIAMCFAFHAFANVSVSTSERLAKMAIAIAVHANRIEKNINFAISTRTNHALTEAAGLYITGLLFPEFSRSSYWFKLGKNVLTTECLKQIYPDGSYIQHSMNYHRLMLHTFLWAVRLAQLNGDSFCDELMSRLDKATQFLYNMLDEFTGRAPNYGSNDGSLILPLNCCNYLDYRPVIQSMYYLLTNKKLFNQGAWDEDLLWLFGPAAVDATINRPERLSAKYSHGGYYTLREKNSWAMVRCHTYKDRPVQADMLHVDLWWQGINVLRDSGSFMYYCEKPWQHYFISTAAHNSVTVDGQDQMTKGSRFIWYDWIESNLPVLNFTDNRERQIFSSSHFGFKRLGDNIIHHRSIVLLLKGKVWVIIDDISGSGVHTARLFWHLVEAPFKIKGSRIELNTLAGLVCIKVLSQTHFNLHSYKGDEQIPAGFQSLYYAERTPATTVIVQTKEKLPVRFVSIISLGQQLRNCSLNGAKLTFTALNVKRCELVLGKQGLTKNVFHLKTYT
ncbi:MAG: alginate lyase family protein [bacterium]|nr:MAG: alginate lyase family protein [bacterium]